MTQSGRFVFFVVKRIDGPKLVARSLKLTRKISCLKHDCCQASLQGFCHFLENKIIFIIEPKIKTPLNSKQHVSIRLKREPSEIQLIAIYVNDIQKDK